MGEAKAMGWNESLHGMSLAAVLLVLLNSGTILCSLILHSIKKKPLKMLYLLRQLSLKFQKKNMEVSYADAAKK